MKILCWNTNEAVWNHWNQVTRAELVLVRAKTLSETYQLLENAAADFAYCFIYLADETFSEQVEQVVSLHSKYPNHKIIVFPNKASQDAALRLFSVGINGQCAPYIGRQQLELVMEVVDSGEIWGGKSFIEKLIMQNASVLETQSRDVSLDDLSERENKVAHLVAQGLSNKEVAKRLDITERTIKAHLTAIFKKTTAKDRLSLAMLVQKSHKVH